MIVTKTPLRVPFAGGLTDVAAYARAFGGVTVSSTIDRYVYVVLKDNVDGVFELDYLGMRETETSPSRIRNDLIRETLRLTELTERPLTIHVLTDLASESGLGASGALTVGLLHAMHLLKGDAPSPEELARQACHIEVETLDGASGYHDPTITAIGGHKRIAYDGSGVEVSDVVMSEATRSAFWGALLFFYSGRHARTKPSLELLGSHMDRALDVLHAIRAIGFEIEGAFASGDLPRICAIIGEQQALKQRLPGKFVDDYVVEVTERVRAEGAYAQLPGGKISAFLMVACPDGEAQKERVRRALHDHTEVRFAYEPRGTQGSRI